MYLFYFSRPIDDLVLQMKSMDIEKVIHFPFPTPPDIKQLYAAERRLLLLNALEPPPRNIRLKRKFLDSFAQNYKPSNLVFREPRMDIKDYSTGKSHGRISTSTTLRKNAFTQPTT
jgi:HrpA-like RNA helicase